MRFSSRWQRWFSAIGVILLFISTLSVSRVSFGAPLPRDIAVDQNATYKQVSGSTKNVQVGASGVSGSLSIENKTTIWLSLEASAAGGAQIEANSIFASLDILPPEGVATYRGSFSSVGQTAAITARYDVKAMSFNVAQSLLNIIPGGNTLDPASILTLVESLSKLNDFQKAVRELEAVKHDGFLAAPGHIIAAADSLRKLVDDDTQAKLFQAALAKVGLNIGVAALKDVLTILSIKEEIEHIIGLISFNFTTERAIARFTAIGAPPTAGIVEGRVVGSDRIRPIAGATVAIQSGNITKSTGTDSLGRYRFEDVPAGQARIDAVLGSSNGSARVTAVAGQSVTAPPIVLSGLVVALVIDSSGSMYANDPGGLRRAAAKVLVQALDSSDMVTVVDFDGSAIVRWPLSSVANAKGAITAAIDQVDDSGSTNISAGLQAAYQELSKAGDGKQIVTVLLTDGRQDPAGTYDKQWEDRFAQKHWPTYTFGLSSYADSVLLARLARRTGGQFAQLGDARQLVQLYNRLRIQLTQAQLVTDRAVQMKQGDTVTQQTVIPLYSRVATFVTSWPGSRVDTTLYSPSGVPIGPNTSYPGVTHVKGDTFEIYRIEYPLPGNWRISSYGAQLNAGGEIITLQADVNLGLHRVYAPTVRQRSLGSTAPSPTPVIVPTNQPITPTATSSAATPTATRQPATPTASITPTATLTPPITGARLSMRLDGPQTLVVDNGQLYPNPFTISAIVSNIGSATAMNVELALNLPDDLNIVGPDAFQTIGNLAAGTEQRVLWVVSPYPFNSSQPSTTTYRVTATATNVAEQFAEQSIRFPALPDANACVTSSRSWQTQSIGTQQGTFVSSFIVTPNAANMDGVIGFSAGPAIDYASLAAIVRFNPQGYIDVRDGATYRADTLYSYAPGVAYRFRIVVRVPEHTYDVFVRPANGSEEVIGTNLAFRAEQASVAALNTIVIRAATGSLQVCGVSTTTVPRNASPLTSTWFGSVGSQGTLSFALTAGDIINDGLLELSNSSGCPSAVFDFGPAPVIGNHFATLWNGGDIRVIISGMFDTNTSVVGRYIVEDARPGSPCAVNLPWTAHR